MLADYHKKFLDSPMLVFFFKVSLDENLLKLSPSLQFGTYTMNILPNWNMLIHKAK